jgi:hypothetical protein
MEVTVEMSLTTPKTPGMKRRRNQEMRSSADVKVIL